MIESGSPYNFHISRINSIPNSYAPIAVLQGMKCRSLDNLSTTTIIVLWPLVVVNIGLIKSIERSF